jgi:hypothetical protein
MYGALAGAVVALTFALSWSLVKVPKLEDEISRTGQQNQALDGKVKGLEGKVDANAKALEQANARLIALGKAPEPIPADPAPSVPPVGLTASQLLAVRAVVTEVLESTDAKVSQASINQISRAAGKLAQDNLQVGLPAAVRAAVDAFCANDRCVKRGPRGLQGERGLKGDDAPAVTDEQLLTAATAALATYCGGETKPCQGPQGLGIREITCRDTDLMWVFTMTDDTTQLVRGPCRVVEEQN